MLILYLFTLFETLILPDLELFDSRFNPAALYQGQAEITVGIAQKFGLSNLRTYVIQTQLTSYGFSLKSFGNSIYRENMLNFGYGFGVLNRLSVGVNTGLLHCWIKERESKFTYTLKTGGIFQIARIEISAWLANINSPKFSAIDYLPLTYAVGFKYLTTDQLTFDFIINGVGQELPFYNFRILYTAVGIVKFCAGINTDEMLIEYGVKIILGRVGFIYSGSNHPHLGLSHCSYLTFFLR